MILCKDGQFRHYIARITDVHAHVDQGLHWVKPPAVLVGYRNEDDHPCISRTRVIPCNTEDEAYALAKRIRQEEGLSDAERGN